MAPGISSKTSVIAGEQGTSEGTAFVTGITVGLLIGADIHDIGGTVQTVCLADLVRAERRKVP